MLTWIRNNIKYIAQNSYDSSIFTQIYLLPHLAQPTNKVVLKPRNSLIAHSRKHSTMGWSDFWDSNIMHDIFAHLNNSSYLPKQNDIKNVVKIQMQKKRLHTQKSFLFMVNNIDELKIFNLMRHIHTDHVFHVLIVLSRIKVFFLKIHILCSSLFNWLM